MNTAKGGKRRWTREEERFIWSNRERMTANQLGAFVQRSSDAVLDKLKALRTEAYRGITGPERQAIADEVCKHLAQLIVTHRMTREQGIACIERLSVWLEQPDDVIEPCIRWSVSRWIEHISP